MKNPTDVANRWASRLASSSEAIKAGVMGVTVNPAERALARQSAYIDGVQRAVSSGKYARGLRTVTLESWKQATLDKGIPRIASGATAAKGKFTQFMEAWLPYMDQLKSKLQSMPRGDLQQNIARMVATVEHAAAFKGRS